MRQHLGIASFLVSRAYLECILGANVHVEEIINLDAAILFRKWTQDLLDLLLTYTNIQTIGP